MNQPSIDQNSWRLYIVRNTTLLAMARNIEQTKKDVAARKLLSTTDIHSIDNMKKVSTTLEKAGIFIARKSLDMLEQKTGIKSSEYTSSYAFSFLDRITKLIPHNDNMPRTCFVEFPSINSETETFSTQPGQKAAMVKIKVDDHFIKTLKDEEETFTPTEDIKFATVTHVKLFSINKKRKLETGEESRRETILSKVAKFIGDHCPLPIKDQLPLNDNEQTTLENDKTLSSPKANNSIDTEENVNMDTISAGQ